MERERGAEKEYTDPEATPWIDVKELNCWPLYRAVITEFVATMVFLYIAVTALVGYKNESSKHNNIGLLGIAWVFGGMIFVLVYCTAGISGGHLNPAVTFGMLIARKCSLPRALMYVIAQCLGAVCGVGFVKVTSGVDIYRSVGGGANSVSAGYTNGSALGAEILGTFVLVFTIFSATDPKRKDRDSHVPTLAPLVIGFAVFMVHLGTISIGGTGINPARSFGAAVVYNNHQAWSELWIFVVGPLLGSLIATSFHQLVIRASNTKKIVNSFASP